MNFEPSRAKAIDKLNQFVEKNLSAYSKLRNFDFGPDKRDNVSCLSPYVTHGVLSGGAVARVASSPLNSLVTTDSIAATEAFRVAKNVKHISIAPLLGEAVKRIHMERSVSSLFD